MQKKTLLKWQQGLYKSIYCGPATERLKVPGIDYGVATISRLLTNICCFCKRALYQRLYSAKETYNFKEPTNRSYTI